MCELIFGLVEHAVLQKKNLPRDTWKNCWRPYALERLEQSNALEHFFDPNAHWYTREMRKEMRSIKRELDRKRARTEWPTGRANAPDAKFRVFRPCGRREAAQYTALSRRRCARDLVRMRLQLVRYRALRSTAVLFDAPERIVSRAR
jgi:hypothetical protein